MAIYIGDVPVTVYKGDTQIQSISVGEVIVDTYTN
jgi:hypothetical protein